MLKPHEVLFLHHGTAPLHLYIQSRWITKVRLKWVKNRPMDLIVCKDSHLKAASLLKDALIRSPTGFLTARSVADWKTALGLTIPVLRFLRRHRAIFQEFPHPRYPSLPCFRLTDTAILLHSHEQAIHAADESGAVERLSRLLMMCKSRALPFRSLFPLRWDLGLPDDFHKSLVLRHPDRFRVGKGTDGLPVLSLARWDDDLAVSEIQKKGSRSGSKRDQIAVTFAQRFPKNYGKRNKVKAWMGEFQKGLYVSPYEDSRGIDPASALMEKRRVGVFHELLSLTIHKRTKRDDLKCLTEELNLPVKFTPMFTRYPGMFYLSLKCKASTVTLLEGYERARLVDPHPLARARDKLYFVMTTGLADAFAEEGSAVAAGEGQQEEDCWEEAVSASDSEDFG